MATKCAAKAIPSFQLDRQYLLVHKEGLVGSGFGHDGTFDLLENGFGLYSSVKVREKIGPLKSAFYRIGFTVGKPSVRPMPEAIRRAAAVTAIPDKANFPPVDSGR